MEPLLAVMMLLAAVLGVPWTILGGLDLFKRWAWLRAGRRLGLRFKPGGLLAGDALSGQRNGRAVWILARHRRRTEARIHLPDLPDGVELRAARWLKSPGFRSLGDQAFDRRVAARGPDGPLRARLGRESRPRVAEVLQNPPGPLGAELWVSGGEVAFACPGMILRARGLERIVRAMEALARALRTPKGIPDHLCRIALDREEPHAIREGALRALVLQYGESPAAVRASGALLETSEPTLRIWAGRGMATTLAGASALRILVHDRDLPASLRAEALRCMVDVDAVSVRDTALDVLESGPAALRTAAAKRLAAYPENLSDLVRHTRREIDEGPQLTLLQVILHGIEAQHCPEREAALLALLQSSHRAVRSAAVQGLGRVGGRASIPPLHAIRRSRWHDPTLGRHIDTALGQIRTRLGPAEAGQLSVTERPAEGALGFSTAERGTLSGRKP